jgi:protein TonB
MTALMKTLANCRDSLRKYYHIDQALQDQLKSRARTVAPLVSIFSTDDYPAQAVFNRDSGLSSIVLLVDENGKLADCMVDQTSGVASLDAMSCQIIRQRAKFVPAIVPDGKPAKDAMTTRIRWERP